MHAGGMPRLTLESASMEFFFQQHQQQIYRAQESALKRNTLPFTCLLYKGNSPVIYQWERFKCVL